MLNNIFRGRRLLMSAALLAITALLLAGCRTPEQKKARFLATGNQLLKTKDYQRAVLQFKNAVQLGPKDADAHYGLAQSYLALGGFQQAAAELYKATELDPKNAKAQLSLAELLAGSSNKDLIEDAYKRAAAVSGAAPDNADALTTLALTELRLGQPENAERDTLKALEKAPANLKSSMLLVAIKLGQKDLAGAEQTLKQAVAEAPKSAEPLLALARFYRGLRRFPEAEARFQEAVQIDPRNGQALVDLAALEMATGKKQLAEDSYGKAAALPGRQFKAVHALFLMADKRLDAAIAELKQLYGKDPNDRDLRNLLVRAYLTTKKTQDATNLLTAVLAKNSKDVDALMQRAAIRINERQFDDAQKDLLPVLSLKPDLGEAHYMLAKVRRAQGNASGYRAELEEAVRRDPRLLAARLEMVSLLVASGTPQAAMELIDQTPPDQRRNLPVLIQRTGVLLANGRLDEAEKDIAAGLKMGRNPELLVQDAIAKLQRKDTAAARKSLEEALAQNPENMRALEILVSTYSAQKQMDAAIAKVQEYLAKRPQSAVLPQFLGQLYMASGQPDRARAAFLAAKSANPKATGVDLRLAELDLAQNRLVEAKATLTPMLTAEGGNSAALLLLAQVEQRSGNAAAAIDNYRKVLANDSKNVMALNDLAYVLSNEMKWDEAMGYAQQAKELAPGDMTVEDTLGWIYYRKGLYSSAVPHLEAAVAKAPSAVRKYHLAMAYLKAGDRQRGATVLEQAVKMDPKLPEAQEARQVLMESNSAAQRSFR
jgi:putative PEP-CTERM system TPR-repeat lipoprotein